MDGADDRRTVATAGAEYRNGHWSIGSHWPSQTSTIADGADTAILQKLRAVLAATLLPPELASNLLSRAWKGHWSTAWQQRYSQSIRPSRLLGLRASPIRLRRLGPTAASIGPTAIVGRRLGFSRICTRRCRPRCRRMKTGSWYRS